MVLAFSNPVTAPGLPCNYMPAALEAVQTGGAAPGRGALALGGQGAGIRMVHLGGALLADPAALSAALPADAPGWALAAAAPGHDGTDHQIAVTPLSSSGGATRTVVVIDTGIAFWNRVFRDTGGVSRFEAVAFLPLSPVGSLPVLGSADIAAVCTAADGAIDDTAIIAQLAAQFPESYYGLAPNPHDAWHGTASAALAADPGDRLIGIELPAAALTDWTGDTLQWVLLAALHAALQLVRNLSGEVVILLAYGFPGGPHDGSHPAAQVIDQALVAHPPQPSVKLVVPLGNHLQDQCHARLAPSAATAGAPDVIWRLASDDFSANTVEMTTTDPAHPVVILTAPDRSTATVQLSPGMFCTVTWNGVVIGGLHHTGTNAGVQRLRLSLGQTAEIGAVVAPTPMGDWRLAVHTPAAETALWILRDENEPRWDQGRPRRGSSFEDASYRTHDELGEAYRDDAHCGRLRRSGTASALSTATSQKLVRVQADEDFGPLRRCSQYSGRRYDGSPADLAIVVDSEAPLSGLSVPGNGGPRAFRVSGTSVAAAAAVRQL